MSYTEYILGSKHIEVSPAETLYSCNFIQGATHSRHSAWIRNKGSAIEISDFSISF